MAKMEAVQVPKAGGELEIVERDIPEPGPGQVRINVEARSGHAQFRVVLTTRILGSGCSPATYCSRN